MNKTTFDGYFKASADQTHPFQTNIEFVFTDFKPNRNKQGVPQSEAENIIRTGINMPIKVDYNNGKVKGHMGAIPVGPIISMGQSEDRIIGHAILWNDEFADLASYLEKASASDTGVQFSWELYYKEASIDSDGISWLQDCVVAGAAIVADPAYAGRTPLLAIAEEQSAMELDQIKAQVAELTDKLYSMLDALYAAMALPGSVDKSSGVEEQFATVLSALKGMSEKLASAESEIATTSVELAELRTFKQTAEAEKARAEVITTRRAALKDVITSAEFDEKIDFLLGLSEDQFTTYADSLVSVASKSKASASNSNQTFQVPDSLANGRTAPAMTTAELAKALREANR